MNNLVVLVHGWSVTTTATYGGLADALDLAAPILCGSRTAMSAIAPDHSRSRELPGTTGQDSSQPSQGLV